MLKEYLVTLKDGMSYIIIPSFYIRSDRIAIRIYDKDHHPYTTLSVNLPNIELEADNEFFCKSFDENKELAVELLKTEYFEDTGRFVAPENSFCIYPVWKFIKK